MQWDSLHIPEMDCSEEFALIKQRLDRVAGVVSIQADYLERVVRIQRTEDCELDTVRGAIRELGFHAFEPQAAQERLPLFTRGWRDYAVAIGVACIVIAAAFWFGGYRAASALFATAATVFAGVPVAAAAWRALRARRIDMNVLMLIAAIGATLIGERFEAATAMCLFGFAAWLEERSFHRARMAVRSLGALVPDFAHRFEGVQSDASFDASALVPESLSDVPPDNVLPGDILLVKPGERVPVDAAVMHGDSEVVEAHITGEALPVAKGVAAALFAGSTNGDGSLIVRATATAKESAPSRLAELVAQARLRQSPTERFVDRFARWYTPAVVALAVVITIGAPLILGMRSGAVEAASFVEWLHRGLVLLVIACPCALVMSTPITLVCGLHRATRLGVLIKGGDHLEAMARLSGFAFDKTGTLTTGNVQVASVQSYRPDQYSDEQLLQLAASIELQSVHPLAAAVVEAAHKQSLELTPASDVETYRGLGVSGKVDGRVVAVGSARFHEQQGRDLGSAMLHANESEKGRALVSIDNQMVGAIFFADEIREDANHALAGIRDTSATVAMLTGDREDVATRVANEVGIDDVRAALLPEQKLEALADLQKRGSIAMVGDGLNDAAALVQADVGIAMGRNASDLALDSADVVVLSPMLTRVPQAYALAKQTRRTLWQNIILAIALKAVILLITALGYGSMWLAVAADVGASLLVVANGMRLLRYNPPVCCEAHSNIELKHEECCNHDHDHACAT